LWRCKLVFYHVWRWMLQWEEILALGNPSQPGATR